MAKKKRAASSNAAFPGVTFTSEVIRHVNKQTFSGDSSVSIAEAIPTPGYSEVGYSGCFVVGAQISIQPDVIGGLQPSDSQWVCQLQAGDREASPAVLDPDEVGFFGQLVQTTQFTTSGYEVSQWPKPLAISMPVPIVVLPKITVVWDVATDVSEWQSKNVFCEIFYRTVKLADRAYTGLLLQQQRTS